MQELKDLFPANTSSKASSCDYEERRIARLNATQGKLTGYDCPVCKNKGYIYGMRDGVDFCHECECMSLRRAAWNAQRSGLGDMLERYTLDNYKTPEPWQQTALKKAREYLRDPAWNWFLLSGVPGSGKSHLCTAVCGELLNAGLSVRYMLWRDDGRKLKAAVNDNGYEDLIRPLKRVKVLYIDDFFKAGRGGVTDADINLAFELLNARYNDKGLLTLISTELSPEQIMEIDMAVGSRIYERSRKFYLRFTGDKNWRLRGANQTV